VGEDDNQLFLWTMAYINLYSPQASARLDTLEADCKFFRNFVPTILLSVPFIEYCLNSRVSAVIETVVGLGLSGRMLVSGLRYFGLQLKLMTSAYMFLILLFSTAPEATNLQGAAPESLTVILQNVEANGLAHLCQR
jgi:hypothetical protein